MSLIDKIKLLFKVRQPVTELINEGKQISTGYKTLAFWATVLITIGSAITALAGIIPAVPALIAGTAVTLVYNIIRAFQNADTVGVTPVFQSTRFWTGILSIVSMAIVSLQTGGINPAWLASLSGLIGTVMAMAQNLGAQQPDPVVPPVDTTPK